MHHWEDEDASFASPMIELLNSYNNVYQANYINALAVSISPIFDSPPRGGFF
jgi:hypothetical protein